MVDGKRSSSSSIRKWRLIVRNVSFKCQESDLQDAFKKFGEIFEIQMPQKKGRFAGFCFVQFKTYDIAAKAMKEMNGKEIKDRIVAVDWAIPKDQYMTAVIEEKRQKKDDEDAKIIDAQEKISKNVVEELDEQEDEESDDEDEDDNAENSISEKDQQQTSKAPPKPSDVNEGKTLFIRGLPFEVDEEELGETFEKFGPIHYAVICKFRDSDHSKGSGFVKFVDKSSVDSCLTTCNAGEGVVMKGRRVNVCLALDRKEAVKISSEKNQPEPEPKDKRNLHLLRVGLIRSGTKEANGMSDKDTAKRLRIEAANRQKIKNLDIFVSPTRLVIHNLPATMTDKALKILCLKAIQDRSAFVKECRIMRDKDRVNSQGVAKSRGYAFVEFEQHKHAMDCLKKMNNNPDIFTDVKRPIVEFSLENRLALNAKLLRLEKSKLNAKKTQKEDSTVGSETTTAAVLNLGGSTNRNNSSKKKRKLLFKPPTVPAPANCPKNPFPSHMGPKIRTNKRGLKSKSTGPQKSKKKKI